MAAGIFISYRRDDTRQAAGRLADGLVERFGKERIFRDIEGIDVGLDFEQTLNKALSNCEVMLVLIGSRWKDITDPAGVRRLEDPKDWIRTEIVTALRRNIRIVPLLVDGASLPQPAELPEDMRPLVGRQAFELDDRRWHSDLERLTASLDKSKGRKKLVVGAAGAVALVLAWRVFGGGGDAAPGVPNAVAADNAATAAPPAEPVAPAVDITGNWKNHDGSETYQFTQRGNQVTVDDYVWKKTGSGKGKGTMTGDVLAYGVMLQVGKESASEMNCKLILALSGDLSGNCRWKDQDYPLHLQRRP